MEPTTSPCSTSPGWASPSGPSRWSGRAPTTRSRISVSTACCTSLEFATVIWREWSLPGDGQRLTPYGVPLPLSFVIYLISLVLGDRCLHVSRNEWLTGKYL